MKVSPWTGKAHCEDCQLYFTEITEHDIQICFPNPMLSYTFVYCPKCNGIIKLPVPNIIYDRIMERNKIKRKRP